MDKSEKCKCMAYKGIAFVHEICKSVTFSLTDGRRFRCLRGGGGGYFSSTFNSTVILYLVRLTTRFGESRDQNKKCPKTQRVNNAFHKILRQQ